MTSIMTSLISDGNPLLSMMQVDAVPISISPSFVATFSPAFLKKVYYVTE